ncbi:MAG: glycosyltransferase family 2 protein [Lachnospiraceae bacterium]|nr:glycosyltransferase family 2 protein [Lachnospiraceae bacterium]
MTQNIAVVERERFDLSAPGRYIIQGTWRREAKIQAFLDQREIEAEVVVRDTLNFFEQPMNLDGTPLKRVTVKVQLPEDTKNYKKLNIYAVEGEKRKLWHTVSARKLAAAMGKPQEYLEYTEISPDTGAAYVSGWVAFTEEVQVAAFDMKNRRLDAEVRWTDRVDVAEMFEEAEICPKCGFHIELADPSVRRFKLIFKAGSKMRGRVISLRKADVVADKAASYTEKGMRYFRTYGFSKVTDAIKKGIWKVKIRKMIPEPYPTYLAHHLPKEAELAAQRKEHFSFEPLMSIVVPLYKTPEDLLKRMVESVQAQTYSNWELLLSDGSGKNSPIAEVLQELSAADNRIKVISHDTALKISENTNAAIEAAQGEYIVFMDHDDELTPHALYENVKLLNEHPEYELIYSDEDKMNMAGDSFYEPAFKPDFNQDLLTTVNYICHLCVVKREIIDQVGMLRPEFDGAQDYDFILRATEAAGRGKIGHIAKILYHWRCHDASTAENPESKLYAFDAGRRAVQAHFDRIGVPAKVSDGQFLGLYRTKFLWEEKPLISILIPNKDHTEDLDRIISSIEEKSTYRNYEYIIIENNSDKPETFEYYKKLEAENPKAKVVYWEEGFNYSAINNFGAQFAKGEYLLLLNNDTEIINPDCLEELLGYCMRDEVGAVGARLYYEDNTIQHAGVVLGWGGVAGHCFVQQLRSATGYCHRIIEAQNYSAVTAACMMVKRKAFDEVGGLTEELAVAFNDIDFCMKLGKAGYLIVYNPYAELYHYESKSRGLEDTPEKIRRFQQEIATFHKYWSENLKAGDPMYNPNLTMISQDFSLKRKSEF